MCKEKNIIISKVSNKREENLSLTVDWQDGRSIVVVVNVFWDQFLLIWAKKEVC